MSEINAVKPIASDSNRIQRTKQSNRQGGRSRDGAEEQFHERLQEQIDERQLHADELTEAAADRERGTDQNENDPDAGAESTPVAREAAKLRYPGEIGRNTDITA